jgi:hypothetical protein
MRKFIFLSNEGQTIAPNEAIEVDNLQVLGIVDGAIDEDVALQALLNENPWIRMSGFDIDSLIVHELK